MADEVSRRLVHAAGAVVPASYVFDLITWPQLQLLLVGGSVVAVVLEGFRLYGGLEWRVYEKLTREYEQENVAGYALYVFSMTVVVLVFAPPSASIGVVANPGAALAGMFMLSIGDPISGLLGSGDLRQVKRSYVLLVMFGVCTLLARAFVPPVPAIVGGAAAAIADGTKPIIRGYVVDDNLTIPIAGAAAISATVAVL